jgi:hypothetical protein
VNLYVAALRYHQMVPLHNVSPDASAPLAPLDPGELLPLPGRHPGNPVPYDRQIAIAFEPWMLPGPLQSVYVY